MLSRLALAASLVAALGCGNRPSAAPEPLETIEEVDDHARHAPAPEVVVAPASVAAPEGLREYDEARELDTEYAGDAMLVVRRIVYRFSLRLRGSLGGGTDTVPEPTAELRVDVTPDRLRARFAGTGWPVASGSEIRMRRDRPGAYLVDGRGGRTVGAGMIAQWFEGGAVTHEADLRFRTIAPARGATEQAVATMFCRLLAEWANGSPDGYARRCSTGIPVSFYFGPYYVERTAELTLRAPRSSVRADHLLPPEPEAFVTHKSFVRPEILARLEPNRRLAHRGRAHDAGTPPVDGLVIENRAATRLLVSVEGNAVGWLDAGTTASFLGLRPGTYAVGGGKPLGGVGAYVRPVAVPGTTRFPR